MTRITAQRKPRGGKGDWIADRVLRALIRLALRLPLRTRLRLMGWTVARVIAPLAGYRARAMENLAHVWPDMPEPERRRIADAVADNAGRTMIENYDVPGLLARMKEAGQAAADGFLDEHGDALGDRDTVDLRALFAGSEVVG